MPNKYREITDAFYELFLSFKESGFTDEQAMELTSSYCTSSAIENFLRQREKEIDRSSFRRNYLSRWPKAQEENEPAKTGVGDCQLCGKSTPFLTEITKQIAGEFKQINVCRMCEEQCEKELELTRKNFQDQFEG